MTHVAIPWTPLLADLRARIEETVGESFNSVLLNYYRDGRDSVAWHSDDERELGPAADDRVVVPRCDAHVPAQAPAPGRPAAPRYRLCAPEAC